MRTFSPSFCMFAVFSLPLSLDLLTQITALSCSVCTTERSQWGPETQAIVGIHLLPFSGFHFLRCPGSRVDKSRHSVSAQLHCGDRFLGKQGNPGVGAPVRESGHPSPGPCVAVNRVTGQSGLESEIPWVGAVRMCIG